MAKVIALRINAGERTCDACEFLTTFKTGLAGEWHKHCEVFGTSGRFGESNMQRPKACHTAEKLYHAYPTQHQSNHHLLQRIAQAISDEILSGAPSPDWQDSREIDRLAKAAINALSDLSTH